MARYIDADKLCEALKSMASVQYPDKQNTILGVVSSIENFLTADVVPKSEWNRIYTELEGLKSSTLPRLRLDLQMANTKVAEADMAKAEVVRKIFEEVEERLASLEYRFQSPRKTVKIEELKAQVDWILHEVVPKTLAKLKKKYIGDENDKRDTV